MVLDCAGELAPKRSRGMQGAKALKCSEGAYEIEGAIPRCCKFQRRSRDCRPIVSERGRKARTWTI